MRDPQVRRDAERFVPVAQPTIGKAERLIVDSCLTLGHLSHGQMVREFERTFAEAHGKKFGVACNSGTSALQLALVAADVGKGDVVACPTMTMVACANAILAAGAEPYFVDSEPATGNIDLLKLAFCPKAAILVHLYGVPIDIPRFQPETKVIEDAAEAHYAAFPDGSPVGSRGDFACFSFYANKIITTMGEGGIVLTDDEATAERLRGLRAHAFDPAEHFNHCEHAWGMRMTSPQAAFGLAQHGKREEFLRRRHEIYVQYTDRLYSVSWMQWQGRGGKFNAANWVFPILVIDGYGQITRDYVRAALAEKGVETRTWFKPMHQQKFLAKYAAGQSFPVADDLYRRGLYLPLHCSMTNDDVDYTCEILRSLRP